MQIYYAHCMSIYNSPQERRDIELIKKLFPNDQIYNPGEDEDAKEGYQKYGMDYFIEIINQCDLLIFRSAPGGKITAGVFEEISYADEHDIPVIELPSFLNRNMSIGDTRVYLKEIGFR